MHLILDYVVMGDKYLMTLKCTKPNQFICKKQEVPRDFAIYQVPVDELDDPGDVLRVLKDRLVNQIKNDFNKPWQISTALIDRSFF